MVSRRKARPSVEAQPIVISAPSLKEAYRRVKSEMGDDAIIVGSRTVTRRQSLGLGNKKMVEVMIQPPGTSQQSSSDLGFRDDTATNSESGVVPQANEIIREVERIEELAQAISRQYEDRQRQATIFQDNPLTETLRNAGTSTATIDKIMTRFISETGKAATDRVGALTWLKDHLRASNCDWDGFHGCHAFLGRSGCGRTNLIYQAAAMLQTLGRKTLVLAVMPEHKGEIRRLQAEASRLGFDAAVIQQESQLAMSETHLARYDAVLVDLPALDNKVMVLGGALHTWLATNPSFHRHLVVPLESDPEDLADLVASAKDWHGDWVALSKCDVTGKAGKVLDFCDLIPLPLSFIGERTAGIPNLVIASSGDLLDRVLGTETGISETEKLDGTA